MKKQCISHVNLQWIEAKVLHSGLAVNFFGVQASIWSVIQESGRSAARQSELVACGSSFALTQILLLLM